jgi:ABC-type phosphate transport system substrate-binding protein
LIYPPDNGKRVAEGVITMKNCRGKIVNRRILAGIITLFAGLAPAWAGDDAQARQAPEFSNPDEVAPVAEDWASQQIKYELDLRGSDLVVALGQQSHPIFKDLIPEYAKKHNLKIGVRHGTCGITSGRLRKKSVDIGAFCCPPGKNDRLPGMEFHSLGISPLALIVHPENPLQDVSLEQAREIFRGNLSRWNQVSDGPQPELDRLIQPVARLHCKKRPGHWRGLLGNEDQFGPRLFEVGVIPDMISQVARNPGAIGLEVPLMVSVHKEKGEVRMLKIDGHEPTDLDYVATGEYPFYRTYHLTTWEKDEKTKRIAMDLVRYLQQYIDEHAEQVGYVSQAQLRKAGWKFRGDELVGEPDSIHTAKK